MKNPDGEIMSLFIKPGIVIPEHELEVSTSRSGGAGGQHVNKTETRVTIRWNVHKSMALNSEQKDRILQKLAHRLTAEGELIVHNSSSRSQQHNKEQALIQLADAITKALHIPKKRMKTRISHATKESRLHEKKHHGEVKKMRRKPINFD